MSARVHTLPTAVRHADACGCVDCLAAAVAAALAQHTTPPPAEPSGPDVLHADQAATHLGISRHAVYRAVRKGELPGRKVGSRWLFSRTALDQFLAHTR